MIVAIDGPAASGKSITAKLLADKLNFIHLNTGLMYRALTYLVINNKVSIVRILNKGFFKKSNLKFRGKNLNKVFFDDINITDELYDENINSNIKEISNHLSIRKKIIKFQRLIVNNKNVVCEGRDIGSVVFPEADFKFFLIADLNSRVLRRYNQLMNNYSKISKKEVEDSLIERDYNDINRLVSPLKKVEDSIEIDTTSLTIDKQVEILYSIILNKGKNDK